METIEQHYKKPYIKSLLPEMDTIQTCFLDIETTGFHRLHHQIILVGLMTITKDTLFLRQWFANDLLSEKEILINLIEVLNTPSHLVTFNGESFDLNFICARMIFHQIASTHHEAYQLCFGQCLHTDLYKVGKRLEIPGLPNRKLKTLEKLLNIERCDTISGKESIALYRHFLRTQDTQARHQILTHNAEDIINMFPLYDLHLFLENPSDLIPYYDTKNQLCFTISSIISSDNALSDPSTVLIEGLFHSHQKSFYCEGYQTYSFKSNRFHMRFHTKSVQYDHHLISIIDYTHLQLPLSTKYTPSHWLISMDSQWQVETIASRIIDLLAVGNEL